MALLELIELLRKASDVKEIDRFRDEITDLIPETRRMVDFNQHNYAHQYDLWEHSLQTVVVRSICIITDILNGVWRLLETRLFPGL